ncbi:hypothetical protein LSH36_1447g00000 [Paralvinella palmiformis]|uniref:Uncharacterized protein n=1 Tax=Paralvinella palmiformis TaxID=53620 RepID=A0AAD9IT30_9ANNE|nr:hypothetical protein LSH36_1447g00000 [Paralvinella palmiformis]
MMKWAVLCLALTFVAVEGWPRAVRSQGWYQCCCAEENPDCPAGCFICRNYVYSCECSTCSCYSGNEQEDSISNLRTSPKNGKITCTSYK